MVLAGAVVAGGETVCGTGGAGGETVCGADGAGFAGAAASRASS